MKNKEIIIQKNKSNMLFKSSIGLRALIRFAVIITAIVSVVYISIASDVISDLTQAKKVGWNVIVTILILLSAWAILRLNQIWIRFKTLNLLMALIGIGYMLFLFIYLPSEQPNEIKEYTSVIYYIGAIFLFTILWYFMIIVIERNSSVYLSKYMTLSAISMSLFLASITLAYFILEWHVTGENTKSINMHDNTQFTYIVGCGFLLLSSLVVVIIKWFIYHKRLKKISSISKNVSLSMALIISLSVAIWYSYSFIEAPNVLHEWLYMIVPIVALAFTVWYALIRKSELASDNIFRVIVSVSMLLILLNKFIFDNFSNKISPEFSPIVTSISIATIALVAFIKNPSMTKFAALAYLLLMFLIALMIIADWYLEKFHVKDVLDNLHLPQEFPLKDLIPTFATVLSTSLALTSVTAWFMIQMTVSRNTKTKSDKINKRKKQVNKNKGGEHA